MSGDVLIAPGLVIRRNASYVFRFTSPTTGRRREMGLGVFTGEDGPIKKLAAELRAKVQGGIDPIDERDEWRRTARVMQLRAKGQTVRRALRLWADAESKRRQWSTRYARDTAFAIEHHPPEWLLATPIVDLKAIDVIIALSEMQVSQKLKDNMRWRLDWAMEFFISQTVLETNPAAVRRIVRGRFS